MPYSETFPVPTLVYDKYSDQITELDLGLVRFITQEKIYLSEWGALYELDLASMQVRHISDFCFSTEDICRVYKIENDKMYIQQQANYPVKGYADLIIDLQTGESEYQVWW